MVLVIHECLISTVTHPGEPFQLKAIPDQSVVESSLSQSRVL